MKKARLLAGAFVVVLGNSLAPFCLGQGWVVLPIREYQSLYQRAYPEAAEPAPPPVEATLTRVDYDLRVEGAVATGTARLTIDVVKDGWVRVPIPPGLLVRDAHLGNDPVPLIPEGNGQLAAVLSHKGRSTLVLDVAFPVSSTGAEERLSLPSGASGMTRAAVSLPQQDVEVTATGGLPPEFETGPANGSAPQSQRWVSYAAGAQPLVLNWHKKAEERREELPLRMRGSLTQLFGLGEDSTSITAEVQVEVLQGAARQVKIAVPDSVIVNQVPGALVADWDSKGGELTVDFLDAVEHTAAFTISAETHLAKDGLLTIPLLKLMDVERETGGVAVEVLGAGEIKESKAEGLDAADASELGQLVASRQSPSLAAFRPRVGADTHSLSVNVVRYAQQAMLTANIEEARYRALLTAEGKMLVEAHYAVRNNQRDFVKVTLPAGSALWSASVAGKPVRPGEAQDGGVLVPLDKNRAGEEAPLFALEILYLAQADEWTAKGHASVLLPALDLPVSRTGVTVFYPPQFRVSATPGAFHAQAYEAPVSDVLNGQTIDRIEVVAGPAPSSSFDAKQKETQALVDQYRARSGPGRAGAAAPVGVSFPSVGPSLYLVSELTGEGTTPAIELEYQKGKEGGAQ